MTTTIVKHQFEDHAIGQREQDGYVNLTQLCKAGGKLVGHYLELDSTKELLSALSLNIGKTILSNHAGSGSLVETLKGGNKAAGTWAHPEVAIDCAQWVSVKLRIWANRTLVKIISGQPIGQQPDLEQRVQAIEAQMFRMQQPQIEVKAKQKSLLQTALQHPNPELKEIPCRTKVRKLITQYCGQTDRNYRNVYQEFYEQYNLTYGYNVYRECAKSGEKCKLTQMEKDEEIDRFHQMVTILTNPQSQAA
jgi:hypothetical protein